MRRAFFNALAALGLAVLSFAALPAVAQGPIGTLARGAYVCELPGDAQGNAGVVQEDRSFTVLNASRYRSSGGGGTYLRREAVVEITTGPLAGDRFAVVSERFLRLMEGEKPGRMRCVRR